MDPVEQILAQYQVLKGNNAPTPQAQAYEQGVQNSLSQRRIDQDQQKIDTEMQMLPLKIHEMQQRERMNSLTLQKQAWQQQDMTDSAEDFLKLNVALGQNAKSPDYDPLLETALMSDFATKHAGAVAFGVLKPLEEQQKIRESYFARKEIVGAQIAAKNAQVDANNINRAILEQDKKTKGPTSLAESQALIDLQDQVDAETDPIKKARLQRNLDITSGQTAKSGETITTYGPDGQPQMTFQRGGTTKGAPSVNTPSQATLDKISAGNTEAQNTISNLNELKKVATRDNVGLKGVLSHQAQIASSAVAAFMGLNPIYTNPGRTTFATLATGTAQQAIAIFKSDGQIGEQQVKIIRSMFPETGINEDVASTMTKIATVEKMLAERQRRISLQYNIALPKEFMKPSELRDRYNKYAQSHPNATAKELEDLRLELYKASKDSPYPGE